MRYGSGAVSPETFQFRKKVFFLLFFLEMQTPRQNRRSTEHTLRPVVCSFFAKIGLLVLQGGEELRCRSVVFFLSTVFALKPLSQLYHAGRPSTGESALALFHAHSACESH